VFILKEVKVFCFDTLLQVFILWHLRLVLRGGLETDLFRKTGRFVQPKSCLKRYFRAECDVGACYFTPGLCSGAEAPGLHGNKKRHIGVARAQD
jgi:hypothetical protein